MTGIPLHASVPRMNKTSQVSAVKNPLEANFASNGFFNVTSEYEIRKLNHYVSSV